MRIRTTFPYETRHEDIRIPLPDGTLLYARVWRPLGGEPVPVLLEYLPYRLTDWTAPRDWQRHPWYAGHGYASVRVDVRGHGNSEGLPGGEDSPAGATTTPATGPAAGPAAGGSGAATGPGAGPAGGTTTRPADRRTTGADTEVADGVAVVEWLAAQPWCDGRVGMFGLAWGGFTALRIAALAPEALKAVVTVCSTDDRYDNDVHYLGGSVLAVDMHAWAATTLAFVCRPPDPLYAGEQWRELWLRRLEAVEPAIHTWLAHQTRDAYWERGSLRAAYGAIDAAVLAVGGWHDPYRDTVLRLVEHLPPDRVRGIIGPWSHQYPDRGQPPGPAIGFLQETLRWWDHHLKGVDTGIMAEPPLRCWISESHRPATVYPELPGRWVGEPGWPSPHVTPVAYALQGEPVLVRSPQSTGLDAGRFFPAGDDADLPPDQRAEDAHSACFDFPVPAGADPIEILGRPSVELALRPDAPTGQVIARLCDVAPDGSSTLVTRGALNLGAREGRDRSVPCRIGETERYAFPLGGIGHTFPPGHRVRLAVSSSYWPWIWPRPDGAGFTLAPEGSALTLPVRTAPATEPPAPVRGGAYGSGDPADPAGTAPAPDPATARAAGAAATSGADPRITFAEPEQAEPLGVSVPATLDEERPERLVVRDVAAGLWRLEVAPRHGDPAGTRVYPDGLELTEEVLDTYTVQEDDPLSARTCSEWTIRLHRPDLFWSATVRTRSEIGCDAESFLTTDEVICEDGDEILFHRTWEKRIPRTAG
ncbi:CocE/NonD family hydrolase [Streptomyces sp. LP05-1]|uniref:CocE/NonD family hydrolase n=1 Tax=Streptomyces pyxinae TaxID=2970734 RepID=A0ABT2CQW6_9ACTN|nr:CocE/NonD family hydrolase [Streptomyces sp. LP05-1]MCS0639076.1 CocE/NonD family hydrolase [Streptomyces sp. LP05-1]